MSRELLAATLCLIAVAAVSPAARAQCTDIDGDGFFYESGCGTLEDCNDAAPGIYPGALELCDGYDNDCDTMFDNNPVCITSCLSPYEMIGDHVQIAAAPLYQHAIVWNGSEFGLAWSENSTGNYISYFARLSAEGNRIGGDRELGLGNQPSIVWTGTEYAVAFQSHPDGIYIQRLDASGNLIGSASHVTQSGHTPSLAWSGAGYGLAWRDDGIQFMRVDATGQQIPGSQVTVYDASGVSTDPTGKPELVWNGGGYGLGYLLNQWVVGSWWADHIFFQALDDEGNLIGSAVDLSGYLDTDIDIGPKIAWSGLEFGVAWHTGASIEFARVDSSGSQIGDTLVVAGPFSVQVIWPDIAWTGSEYGIPWNWYLRDEGYQIYLTRLDSTGNEVSDLVQVTEVLDTGPLATAWTGTEYGITWAGSLNETDTGLFFTRLACGPCLDHDGDEFGVCDDCDDSDNSVYPGAPQLCDGVNNDCDDASWPEVPTDEIDADSDSYSPCSGDCDESDPARNPGAVELCDGIDNNCSGEADDADLDLDRVRDCVDNCLGRFNPMQSDPDTDGLGSLCDLCPFVPDPDQADMDGDGRGDACDCQPIDPGDREPAEVQGLRMGSFGAGSWMLEWAAAPGADAYSIVRGDLAALGPNSYGDCLVEGVSDLSYEDSSAPVPGQCWSYLVQAQNFDCGLGPLGWTSEEISRENPGVGACDGNPHADLYAGGESNVYGTVSGSYLSTHASDDVKEWIQEELSTGAPDSRYSRLEHRWTFDLTPGSMIELHVEGHHATSNDGDTFNFEYSTDGGTIWNPIALATLPSSDHGSDHVAALPAGLSGVVLIRVVDTDHTAGNQTLDVVYIDEMFVRAIP